MGVKTKSAKKLESELERAAIASPLRLEILNLFVSADPMAISDMAALMNRSAGSLYHHVRILEQAGLMKRTGTRPKGKRHEALYLPTAARFRYDTSSGDEDAIASAVKLTAAGFRMAERDLEAALRSGDSSVGGADPDFYAFRLHVRASPALLASINEHVNAILDLIRPDEKTSQGFGSDDRLVALTLALLPIKGREVAEA